MAYNLYDENSLNTDNLQGRYYIIDKDGVFNEVLLEYGDNGLYDLVYIDGALWGKDSRGQIRVYEPYTGKQTITFNKTDLYVNQFCVINDKVIALGANGVETYNKNTGDVEVTEEYLSNILSELTRKNTSYSMRMFCNSKKKIIYFVALDGIYLIDLEKEEKQRGLYGSQHEFGNINNYVANLKPTSNEGFILGIVNKEGISKMFRYDYNAEGIERKSETVNLEVYSLTRNYMVENVVNIYNVSQKHVYLEYTYGVNEKDGKTITDAVNKLNVDLLAKKGPDILLLDGLSNASYIEKGMLEDLSKIVDDDKIYSNLTTPFIQNDKIYGVPLFFKLAGIHGNREVTNSMDPTSF